MPVSFQEILNAFEFAASGSIGEHQAILCRRTGKIYLHSEFSDFDELNDELPDDVEDDERYVAIPDKRELGLGKPLVLDFAREFLPSDFDEVRYIFGKKKAYAKFRALLIRRNALERWYGFESKETERALREWCEFNSIEVADRYLAAARRIDKVSSAVAPMTNTRVTRSLSSGAFARPDG